MSSMQRRFEPWPSWVKCCNEAFNFNNNYTHEERKAALRRLMDILSGPTPLLSEEKERIAAEFVTLVLNAADIKTKHRDKLSQSEICYHLLSNDEYHRHCKKINAFALKLLNRSFSEGIVEVEVSNLKDTSTENRPLKQRTTEMLNFISTNGPHPLVCMSLVDDTLNARFGKKLALSHPPVKILCVKNCG